MFMMVLMFSVFADCKKDIIILLDNSGSVSASEWDDLTVSVQKIIDSLLVDTGNRVSVVHYGSISAYHQSKIWIESDFTNNANQAKNFTRHNADVGYQDYLSESFQLLDTALKGISNADIVSPQKTLNPGLASDLEVFVFIDGYRDLFGSSLVSYTNSADPFQVFNDFKVTHSTRISIVHVYPNGIALEASGAIASVGMQYTGYIESNPGDPEGSMVTPRRIIPKSDFYLTGSEISMIIDGFSCPCESKFEYSMNCLSDSIWFSDLSADTVVAWSWLNNGVEFSTQRHPTEYMDSLGEYTIELAIEDTQGCRDTSSVILDNTIKIQASFGFEEYCDGQVDFEDLSLYSGMNWNWDFGDGQGSTLQHPTHTYMHSDSFQVELIFEDSVGCLDTAIQWVAAEVDTPDFIIERQCGFDIRVASDLDTNAAVHWHFGDSHTDSGLVSSHTYSQTGMYTIEMISEVNGCLDSLQQTIQIDSMPEFSLDYDEFCPLDSTRLWADLSGSITQHIWVMAEGDSLIEDTVLFQPYSDGDTLVLVVVDSFGCVFNQGFKLEPMDTPEVEFLADSVCLGFATSFTDLSTGGDSVFWDFGDGSASSFNNPTHSFAAEGVYPVTLEVFSSSGCYSTLLDSVRVYELPVANFLDTSLCNGQVQFTDESSLAESWHWLFGDGQTSVSANPLHSYATEDSFLVELQVLSLHQCGDTTRHWVQAGGMPAIDFTNTTVCLGNATSFTNQSDEDVVAWDWTFDSEYFSSQENPQKIFDSTGPFQVQLKGTDLFGCSDSISKMVETYPLPDVHILHDNVCQGDTLWLKDSTEIQSGSLSVKTWEINGQLKVGDEQLLWAPAGEYIVYLEVISNYNCTGYGQKKVEVYPLPTSDFFGSAERISPSSHQIGGENSSQGHVASDWYLQDELISENEHLDYLYQQFTKDTLDLCLQTTSEFGCQDTLCQPLYIEGYATLYVPSAFTPNSDFKNEVFRPVLNHIAEEDYEFRILNRWGDVLYQTSSTQDGWDGSYRSKAVKGGVYVWQVNARGMYGEKTFSEIGHVTLLR